MSEKYIPMDLGFEHYSRIKHDLNAKEYAKILAEISKERYAPVSVSEAYDLYFNGGLVLPDKVRVIWMHDIERPSDNFLARRMAEMEHEFGFKTTYNIRLILLQEPTWRDELFRIRELGHEIQYQHEDLVICKGDQAAAIESFKKNMQYVREFFPEVKFAFGHGVFKSGIDSAALVKNPDGSYSEELIKKCGLPESGELYAFLHRLHNDLGEHYSYVVESRFIGGDEFAEGLRAAKPGDVVVFLQHPTWWSDSYDFENLKFVMRESKFFH